MSWFGLIFKAAPLFLFLFSLRRVTLDVGEEREGQPTPPGSRGASLTAKRTMRRSSDRPISIPVHESMG